MKHLFTFCLLFIFVYSSHATHLKGGYIRVARTSTPGLSYNIFVYLLMDDRNGAASSEAQSSITICTGENKQTVTATRQSRYRLPQGGVSLNTYQIQHTYATPGTFTVSVSVENRGDNISNFNAINTSFYIQTTFSANVTNATPTFNDAAWTYVASTWQAFNGDFRATDTEGDSLVYRISKSKTTRTTSCAGEAINSYLYPNEVTREGTFRIDSRTGSLAWNAPTKIGYYSFVVIVEEWRNGVRISESQYETTLPVGDFGGTPIQVPPFEVPNNPSGIITGIDHLETNKLILVPSIAHTRINAIWQGKTTLPIVFQLIDMTGKVLAEYQSLGLSSLHEHSFDTTQLSAGTYLVRINADRVATGKFIKQ